MIMKHNMKPGDKFYIVSLSPESIDPEEKLVITTCTVTKVTKSGRVYFESRPRLNYRNCFGSLDQLRNRYVNDTHEYLGHNTPLKAATRYEESCNEAVEAAERKLEAAEAHRNKLRGCVCSFSRPSNSSSSSFPFGWDFQANC